ncbi:hypothetical protein ACLOJK_005893 [Asimina triloba]
MFKTKEDLGREEIDCFTSNFKHRPKQIWAGKAGKQIWAGQQHIEEDLVRAAESGRLGREANRSRSKRSTEGLGRDACPGREERGEGGENWGRRTRVDGGDGWARRRWPNARAGKTHGRGEEKGTRGRREAGAGGLGDGMGEPEMMAGKTVTGGEGRRGREGGEDSRGLAGEKRIGGEAARAGRLREARALGRASVDCDLRYDHGFWAFCCGDGDGFLAMEDDSDHDSLLDFCRHRRFGQQRGPSNGVRPDLTEKTSFLRRPCLLVGIRSGMAVIDFVGRWSDFVDGSVVGGFLPVGIGSSISYLLLADRELPDLAVFFACIADPVGNI